MAFRRFSALLAARLVVAGICLTALVWLALEPGYHSASIIAAALFALAAAELWRYVSRTNREVARFLDAARYADYSQRFDFEGMGAGFAELGQTFSDIIESMRARANDNTVELRRLTALIEHIPVPLLTLHADGSITLQNNAARRLFGATAVTRLRDLAKFGKGFHDAVCDAIPGDRELVTFSTEGAEYQLTLAVTEVKVAGASDRLISLQDIQSELDATQAEAWQDLVRVLTHEIMNTITPVSSLAATAVDVAGDVIDKAGPDSPLAEDLHDLHDAVRTVARRSDSLLQFVESYRQITRLAPPEKKRIRIDELFESAVRLAGAESADAGECLAQRIDPPGLTVYADRDLLEPVLLNLLRNARQATVDVAEPRIELGARLNRRGNVVIEVADNGHGVPDELAKRIFVPFFTTREGGSGVGLALARQVMIAHGGFIRVADSDSGGALFSLTF